MKEIDFRKELERYAGNPDDAVRLMLDKMARSGTDEFTIVDTSTPAMALIEFAASSGADIIARNLPLERRLYPANARTPEELNLHRSDKDFVGVFAVPAQGAFMLALSVDEIRGKAVAIPGTDTRKITIPRNTVFKVSEYMFSMTYPIDIFVGSHGGITVAYDTSKASPLKALKGNGVEWNLSRYDGVDFLRLTIPVEQFRIDNYTYPSDGGTGFRRSFDFEDRYYFTRIYMRNSGEAWQELKTTMTEQSYSPHEVTAFLSVAGQTVNVDIPQVYYNTGMVKKNIRIEVYTTKGSVDMSFDDYTLQDQGAEWLDFDNDNQNVYTAPLLSWTTMIIAGLGSVQGGGDGMSFEEQREMVVWNNSGIADVPITQSQLDRQSIVNGFSIVRVSDVVTSREYWATRELPAPHPDDGIAPAGTTMRLLATSISQLKSLETSSDNDQRVTVFPNTLYQLTAGKLYLADSTTEAVVRAMEPEDRAVYLNQANLYYSPFYYVYDITGNRFATRPYDFSEPSIDPIDFVDNNDTSGLVMVTRDYEISPDGTNTGFYLDIITRGNETFRELDNDVLKAQLSFIPRNTSQRYYMTAEAQGPINDNKERLFRFHLTTDFDLDENDILLLTSFLQGDTAPKLSESALFQDFDLVYIVEDFWPANYVTRDMDQLVDASYLSPGTSTFVAVSHERLPVRFGYHLESLWTRARSVIADGEYMLYDQDIPMVYANDVYEIDPNTRNRKYEYDPVTKKISYFLLHEAGDPVLDENGDPVYQHREGDLVIDSAGNPIPVVGPYELDRHADLFLIDARYYFATSQTTVEYREEFTRAIRQWIIEDIPRIQERVLEETFIYFYPVQMTGRVEAMIDEGTKVQMKAEQSLTIRATMTDENYRNVILRQSVRSRVVAAVNENFKKNSVDVSTIVEQARMSLGQDVLGVDISGIFSDVRATVATVINGSSRFAIAKRAIALPDGTIAVQDDVTFTPINHVGDSR